MSVSRAEQILAQAATTAPLQLAGSWPEVRPEAFHGLAGEIVRVIEPHTEGDSVGLLLSLLTEFGAIVGPGTFALADSAQHPCRHFVVLVGRSSKGRKGTTEANVKRLTSKVDPAFARDRRLNGFGSGESVVDALRGPTENTDRRLLIIEPEFARLLSVARRDGSTMSTIIRQAWDGGRLAVRSRAGTTVVDDSHVSVIGHISADELQARLTETEVASGFANRFLFACVRRSKLLPSGGNLDDADLDPFVRKFALLATRARSLGTVRRSPTAERLWADLYVQMASDDPGGLLGAIIARDAAQTLRLSLTYALLDGARSIDVQHITAAWALWQYCRDSAAYIFGESLGNDFAEQLLVALRKAGHQGLDGREQHNVFSGHASRRQLEGAREVLVSRGLAVQESLQTGGRPVTVLRAVDCEQSEKRVLQAQRELTPPLTYIAGVSEQSEISEQRQAPDDDLEDVEDPPDEATLARWFDEDAALRRGGGGS